MEGVNQRKKYILRNTPKARAGQAGRQREWWPVEEAGGTMKLSQLGRIPRGNSKEKYIFEFQRLLKF
jgi:hypothetical protein